MPETCPHKFIDLANRLSDTAREIARKYFRRSFTVETKYDESPVTIADREIEATQRRMIKEAFPEHGISGEEYGDLRMSADYVWVLDPIDGTKAFLNGIPVFTNLIGLTYQENPILGMIDQPVLDERWIGAAGHGAQLNHSAVHTSDVTALDEVTVHATTPEMFITDDLAKRFGQLSARTKYRRYGIDCYAYGLLASGYAHLVAEAEMKVQDYMPIVEVVRQAGGVISDWAGQPLGFGSDGTVLASANEDLHAQALLALAN
jgi:inositol-phosphate phosphatase/L-galactose 1-phosphate phosphatase/histidinol-phosphatase